VPVELFDHKTVPVAQLAVKVNVVGEQTTRFAGGVTTGAVGLAFISRFVVELASESQPFDTHLAEMAYVPTLESVRLVPVVLFDHRTVPVAQLAVKVNVVGEQTTRFAGGVTTGAVGLAFISRFVVELASDSQPFDTHLAEMTYVPTLESVRLVPVALFDHKTVPVAQLAVNVNVVGEQTTRFAGGVTTGAVGFAFISRFVVELASDSQPLDTHLAEIAYVPTLESVRLVPVVLFDHKTVPVAQLAVKVNVVGEQTVKFAGGVTTGAVGLALISRFVVELASDSQPLDTHLAEMAYVPTLESVRLVPVELFDHKTVPVAQLAVKVKVFGEHTTKVVGAVTVGAAGS
jgi:hypothetical protein